MPEQDYTPQQRKQVESLIEQGKPEVAKAMARVYQRNNEKAKEEQQDK